MKPFLGTPRAVPSPRWAGGLLLTTLLAWSGCEPPPIPIEMTEAKGVLDAAAQAGAAESAAMLYQEAQSYLRQAQEAYDTNDIEEAQNLAVVAHIKAMSAASRARAVRMKQEVETANERIMKATQEREMAEAEAERYQAQVSRMERILKAESAQEQTGAEVAVRDAKEAVEKARTGMADRFAKEAFAQAEALASQANEALLAGRWDEAKAFSAQTVEAAVKAEGMAAADYQKEKAKEDLKQRNEEVFKTVAAIETIEAKRTKDGIVLQMWTLFQTGSEEIDPDRLHVLDGIAEVLHKYPGYQVVVEGHTDNTGSKAINLALSTARAQSVKDYFVAKKNLPASRFTATGYGSARPIASNDDPKGRQKNRRVEVVLLYPEGSR